MTGAERNVMTANSLTFMRTVLNGKCVLYLISCIMLMTGCATTLIRENVELPDGKKVSYTVYHRNAFTDKTFDTLALNAGAVTVSAEKYSSIDNPEAIKAAGDAVGQAVGEIVNKILEAHGIPSIK